MWPNLLACRLLACRLLACLSSAAQEAKDREVERVIGAPKSSSDWVRMRETSLESA